MSHRPTFFMTIPQQISAEMKDYLVKHSETLTTKEFNMLEAYSNNESLLRIMGFSFFEQWDFAGRTFTLETWIQEIIQDIIGKAESE